MPGAPVGVDARRAAGQHDRLRLARQHLGDRHRVRHDLGVDPRLAHPPRDQLGVLRPEVDDEDQVVVAVSTIGRHTESLVVAQSAQDQGTRRQPIGSATATTKPSGPRM